MHRRLLLALQAECRDRLREDEARPSRKGKRDSTVLDSFLFHSFIAGKRHCSHRVLQALIFWLSERWEVSASDPAQTLRNRGARPYLGDWRWPSTAWCVTALN